MIRKYLKALAVFLLLAVLCAAIATAGLFIKMQYVNNEIATDNPFNQSLYEPGDCQVIAATVEA